MQVAKPTRRCSHSVFAGSLCRHGRSHYNGTILEERSLGPSGGSRKAYLQTYMPSVSACPGPKIAFSGAYFAKAGTLLATRFVDTTQVEEGSGYTLYFGDAVNRSIRRREVLKTIAPEAFAVEHLSGYEAWVRSTSHGHTHNTDQAALPVQASRG